ncbi:hypothetical protein ABFY27_02920 [Akkermansia massiliensis]
MAPWGWEYLKNKQASRELIAAFPEADTDLRRRLELARAMSVLVPPFTRVPGRAGTSWCVFWRIPPGRRSGPRRFFWHG